MIDSQFAHSVYARLFPSGVLSEWPSSAHDEADTGRSEKISQWPAESSSGSRRGRVSIDLVFVLTLCIGLASLAQFISLLSFNPGKGDTACGMLHKLIWPYSDSSAITSVRHRLERDGGSKCAYPGLAQNYPRHEIYGNEFMGKFGSLDVACNWLEWVLLQN
jgi:hypothetical protein